MTYDPETLHQLNVENQLRISELSTALESVTAERDEILGYFRDAVKQLEETRKMLVQLKSDISRLQVLIATGGEL
jgi:predicted  nucleic acid-binding Zn-ribbon protein